MVYEGKSGSWTFLPYLVIIPSLQIRATFKPISQYLRSVNEQSRFLIEIKNELTRRVSLRNRTKGVFEAPRIDTFDPPALILLITIIISFPDILLNIDDATYVGTIRLKMASAIKLKRGLEMRLAVNF